MRRMLIRISFFLSGLSPPEFSLPQEDTAWVNLARLAANLTLNW